MSSSLREIDGDEAKEMLAEMSRNGAGNSRALAKALAALGEEAEQNAQEAAKSAVAEAEKRFKVIFDRLDKANAAAHGSVRESVAEGLGKVKAALQSRDLKEADALVEKLAGAVAEAKRMQSNALADITGEIAVMSREIAAHHADTRKALCAAIEAAVKNVKIEAPARKPWNVTVATRDDAGFAKTLKLVPES